MKHFYHTFFVAGIFFCGSIQSYSQTLQSTPVNIINDLNPPAPVFRNISGFNKGSTCGVDTIYYNYNRTTQFQAVNLTKSVNVDVFAQYFDAPQTITVHGFDFYAWQSSGTSAIVSITAKLYLATTDSLPLGAPLRSVAVNIDSTFGSGQLSVLRKSAVFPSPATVSSAYILILETTSTTNVSVVTNSYQNGDGDQEWLSAVRINNNFVRSHQVSVGGVSMNADFIFKPQVEYEIDADFTFTGCNSVGNQISFSNQSSPVNFNRFYNRYSALAWYCFRWDYGDTSGTYYAEDGQHSYTKRLAYPVSLKDTLFGWRIGCVDQSIKMVYPEPSTPVLSNDGPHCSGDTLRLFSDSFPGGVYAWSGPDNFSSSARNPIIPDSKASMTGTYTAVVSAHGCTSALAGFTSATVNPTPAIPLATNDGPKCVGDTVSFNAQSPSPQIQYEWEGPGNFYLLGSSFVFDNVDTVLSGDYLVRVFDANCTSAYDTSSLYIYPPPMPPVLSAVSASLCAGGDIELIGSSVTGAVFNWRGPDGFVSGQTSPIISGVEPKNSGRYYANVVIGSCSSTDDSLDIIVYALPTTGPISGSDTSTELLEKVYTVSGDVSSVYNWTIQGGTIETGSGTATVSVKWGGPGTGSLQVTEVNDFGCLGDEQILDVSISKAPSGTNVLLKIFPDVAVFPNPTAGHITIQFLDTKYAGTEIRVTDMSGRIIRDRYRVTDIGTDKIQLDFTDILAGVYFLELNVDEVKQYIKIVRQ